VPWPLVSSIKEPAAKRACRGYAPYYSVLVDPLDKRSRWQWRNMPFYIRNERVPDFAVQITVNFHDHPNHEQKWVLLYPIYRFI